MNPGGLFGHALHSRSAFALALRRYVPSLPAHEVPLHRHPEPHFVVVERGHYLSSADGAAKAEAGAPLLVFNPPGTEHRDRFAPGQALPQARYLALTPGWLLWQQLSQGLDLPGWAICWTGPDARLWLARLQTLLHLPDATPLDGEAVTAELAGIAAQRVQQRLTHSPPWLRRAREALSDCPAYSLAPGGLPRLAAELGVHPVHLARSFRRCFGQSPGDFARARRLQAAATRLLLGNEALAELALAAGYYDQAHFTKAFRASFGTTPTRWRALHRR